MAFTPIQSNNSTRFSNSCVKDQITGNVGLIEKIIYDSTNNKNFFYSKKVVIKSTIYNSKYNYLKSKMFVGIEVDEYFLTEIEFSSLLFYSKFNDDSYYISN